jgi:predicted amidohydrolase YtcJ
VARKNLDSKDGESFYPEQNLSLRDAVKSYTVEPHKLKVIRKMTGDIKIGKIADMVILSDDIFEIPEENIPNVKVDMTICGGKVVYKR